MMLSSKVLGKKEEKKKKHFLSYLKENKARLMELVPHWRTRIRQRSYWVGLVIF